MFSRLLSITLLSAVSILAQGRGGGQAVQNPPSLDELPVLGIANVTFKVADLAKARAFYTGILGYAEAFTLKDSGGKVTSVYFKVNDDQFIEIVPSLKPGELSQPVKSPFGLHLIKVEERRSADMSADRKRMEARRVLRDKKSDEAYQEWLRQLRDRSYVEYRLDDR